MQPFNIEEPTTISFKTAPNFTLTVNFKSGQVYHIQVTDRTETKVKFPVSGEFYANAEIIKTTPGIEKPKKIKLPEQDRFFNARLFHVVYNPELKHSPAQIYYEIGRCETGPAFKLMPYQFQKFILDHEKAHCFFSDEFNCDCWALNNFLQSGFNASQAYFALEFGLKKSSFNVSRVEKVYNTLLNNTKK
jgi:hypothetical protein